MKIGLHLFGVILTVIISCQHPASKNQNPIALHPENPSVEINVPSGNYSLTWIDPVSGDTLKSEYVMVGKNRFMPTIPEFSDDIAMRII